MSHQLKIIQLNIKSLRTGKVQFDYYLIANKVDIAILSEIWLKNEKHGKISNYSIPKPCRPQKVKIVALL